MKLSALLESPPDFGNREMPVFTSKFNTYSMDTVERDFDIISKIDSGDIEYWVILRKNRLLACVGHLGSRDKVKDEPGFVVMAQLELKPKPDLSFFKDIEVIAKNVLQVDGVVVYDSMKTYGLGAKFYLALAKHGFVIISDTFQYLGGKALWKKLGRTASENSCTVYVVDDGEPLMDENENLIEYDGANIDDGELWATEDVPVKDRKKYTLFVLKSK